MNRRFNARIILVGVSIVLLALITIVKAAGEMGFFFPRSVAQAGGIVEGQTVRVRGVVGQAVSGPGAGGSWIVQSGFLFPMRVEESSVTSEWRQYDMQ